ncbi:hypothetical protein KKB44_04295 [Candidatus Micrarchaeota archaeon]|nr:hypothetical protein [Candidatus Micrarchaeota archaeon]
MPKEYWPLLVYGILAFIIMIPLLPPGYYLALDMQFGPNSFADFHFGSFYGYSASPYGATMPLDLILATLSDISSVVIIQKLLLFLILFSCGAAMHFSLPKEYGNARYFGGLFYMLNPFVFIRFLAGHWTLLFSYAFWPIAILFFSKFLKRPDKKNLIQVALITFLISINIHALLMLLFVYLVLFLLSKPSLKLIKQTLILAFLVVLLNLFWIVPTVLMFETNYSPASTEAYLADFGAEGDILSIITLHGFWRGGFTYTKDVFDLWYIPFVLIFALVSFGFIKMTNTPFAISLLLIFIFAVLFTLAGFISSIIGPIADFIFFVFRDTQKFVGLLALVYSMLGTCGLYHLTQNLRDHQRTLLLLLILSLPIIYNYGFFGFLGQIGPTTYPEDWAEADRIIAVDPIESNILVLPLHLYTYYPWVNSTQKTLGNPASQFFSKRVITTSNIETRNIYSDSNNPIDSYLLYLRQNQDNINNTAEMLLPLNVRYIIIHKTNNEYMHYLPLYYRCSPVPINGSIDENIVPHIDLVYEGPTLYLFRNNLATGPFIGSNETGNANFTDLAGKNIYSTYVSYEKITPASYQILNSSSQHLVFTRPYNNFIEFNDNEAVPWYQIANGFTYSEPGIIKNKMFYFVLALFLLSWALILFLLINPNYMGTTILSCNFIVLYLLTSNGFLTPPMIGALLIVSIIIASFIYLSRKTTN